MYITTLLQGRPGFLRIMTPGPLIRTEWPSKRVLLALALSFRFGASCSLPVRFVQAVDDMEWEYSIGLMPETPLQNTQDSMRATDDKNRVSSQNPEHSDSDCWATTQTWNVRDKDLSVESDEDGLRISYDGSFDVGHIRSNLPALLGRQNWLCCFEVEIQGYPEGVEIGFSPGPLEASLYWLTDGGSERKAFSNSALGQNLYKTGPALWEQTQMMLNSSRSSPSVASLMSTRVVFGCGLDYLQDSIFLTKNGHYLGMLPHAALFANARDGLPSYPFMRLHPWTGSVCTNFGLQPFKFALHDHPTLKAVRLATAFPSEIIALILAIICEDARHLIQDNYHSPPSMLERIYLLRCALTCRHWYNHFRPCFYLSVDLNDANSSQFLSAATRSDNRFALSVRRLTLHEDADVPSNGAWVTRVLEILLGANGHESHLEFLSCSKSMVAWNISLKQHPKFTMSLRSFYSRLTNLRTLRLQKHYFPSVQDLMRLVGTLRSLEDLHLSYISWGRQPVNQPAIRINFLLACLNAEQCQEQWIMVWMLTASYPRALPTARIRHYPRPALEEHQQVCVAGIVRAFCQKDNKVKFEWTYDSSGQSWHLTVENVEANHEPGSVSLRRLNFRLVRRGPDENASIVQVDTMTFDLAPSPSSLYPFSEEAIKAFLSYRWDEVDSLLSPLQWRSIVIRYNDCFQSIDDPEIIHRIMRDATPLWQELIKRMPQVHSTGNLRLEVLPCDDPAPLRLRWSY